MSSFRSRIRLSALLVIGALLVAFSVLLYSGLSVILHRYLDARLLAFGVNWAEFIEETNEALPGSAHQPSLSEPRGTDSEENRESSAGIARAMIGELKGILRAPPDTKNFEVMFNVQPEGD